MWQLFLTKVSHYLASRHKRVTKTRREAIALLGFTMQLHGRTDCWFDRPWRASDISHLFLRLRYRWQSARHLEVSLPYSPCTALFQHPECHVVRTLYPTTKSAHLTTIQRRADWYISTHIPENLAVCISALFILGRRHVSRYTGNVSEEIDASNFSVIFVGWDTSSYRTAHKWPRTLVNNKKGSKTVLPRSSHKKTAQSSIFSPGIQHWASWQSNMQPTHWPLLEPGVNCD